MKSEIENHKSEILRACPCPIDHKIVEAVTTWAQTSEPIARQAAWSAVVDLINQKTWDAQIGQMHQQTSNIQHPTPNAQCQITEVNQPPY
jgi:hypothetical protein